MSQPALGVRRHGIEVPARAQTRAYPVREILGVIYIWFHAEEELRNTPTWELTVAQDLQEGVDSGAW